MPDTLMLTKISLPMLRNIAVPREKVVRQLSEGIQDGHLLTLVSAPPGYGKTTTIRMWVENTGYPVAWVSLEKSDNDLKQFITYVLSALQHAEDDLGQAALEVVDNAQEINLQQILRLLVNDLYGLEQPIILVLEDYHLIENEGIDQFIELLLNQAVAKLHLVITTREDPNLPLTRLRVRNQLTEIRAMDLSFSFNEANEFFSNVMGVSLPASEMEILESRTEGWAAGLQLAALSLKESGDKAKFVEAFRGTHRHVLDYLIEEVLKSQTEEIREFLRRTSILDQLSAPLCEAVTGRKASREYLHYLERNNLFLLALDHERTWYRFHALFAELLKNQLLQTEPEIADDLHERAADWYEKNGLIQKAVEHAFQVLNGNKLSRLIEKHALHVIYQGDVSTVIGWFDRLPAALMQASPLMCISKAWSLALMYRQAARIEEVQQALQAAEEALTRIQADEPLRNLIAGHAATIQAFSMGPRNLSHEDAKDLIELAQNAQGLLPQDEKAIRSVNAMIMGNAYMALADLSAAELAFNQTFEDGIAGRNFYAAVYGPINLILIAMIRGQLKDAMHLCTTNIDRFNRLLAGQKFPAIGALYILKGCLLLEADHLSEAEQALTQGLSLVRWTGEFRTHIKGYSAQARLRAIQGDRAGMSESLRFLEETRPDFAFYAQDLHYRLSRHDLVASKLNFEEVQRWAIQEATRFRHISDLTGVTPWHEVRFQSYLAIAHGFLRVAAQNPKSYSLQDVHGYFARQEEFAKAHELTSWLIEIWILRALMYHVEGKKEEAQRVIQRALSESGPRGYFRVFLDESDLLRPLLESLVPSLKEADLSAFVKHVLEAMPGGSVTDKAGTAHEEILSDRELDVLRLLAAGQSYKEIGKNLFLSLNTVQFHVKSIYRKLQVNKRIQAVEKARDMKLV